MVGQEVRANQVPSAPLIYDKIFNNYSVTSLAMATFFDPKFYNIILVDQRGCGKSTPFAEIAENTTLNLVDDFEKLRKELGIQKWQLFGGSWGSTLALTYAVS